MRVTFEKLQGAGNDFIFIEDLQDQLELSSEEVQHLCDRHFGIGADGVIVVRSPKDDVNDGFMDYINADGTLAQMCGNGVRCFAKYLVDHGLVDSDKDEIRVETRAGVKVITYQCDENGKLERATVDMGEPILDSDRVPTTLPSNATTTQGIPFCKDVVVDSPYGSYAFTCVSMGNPHAVAFIDDVANFDIDTVGKYFESCDAFPEKANIEFATIRDDGIEMRVYERGCGETLACGTGACATGVAAILTGRVTSSVNKVILRGGTLDISYESGSSVFMTGPAALSFVGFFEREA